MSNARPGSGWRTTIASGNADIDAQMLDRHRQSAQAQGLVLHTRNLQTGGFEVATAPLGAPSPFDAQTPEPQIQPSPAVYPQPAYVASSMGYAPMPGPRQVAAPQGAWAPVPGAGMSCQACGRDAAVKHVTFMQNIGIIFMRIPKTVRGFLCRHCIDKYFFEMTGITLLFGWWGVISFIYTVIALPTNVVNYLGALSLPAPPDDLQSINAKKTRSVVMIVFGVLLGLLASLWTLSAMWLLLSPDVDDVSDGLANLVIAVVLIWVPSLLLFIGGIVKRVRLGTKEAEMRVSGAI